MRHEAALTAPTLLLVATTEYMQLSECNLQSAEHAFVSIWLQEASRPFSLFRSSRSIGMSSLHHDSQVKQHNKPDGAYYFETQSNSPERPRRMCEIERNGNSVHVECSHNHINKCIINFALTKWSAEDHRKL